MDVSAGEDSPAGPSGMYYRRKVKRSEPVSGLSLTSNRVRSWGLGSVTKEWESLYAQKVQLLNFISTLPEPTLSYVPSAVTNMANSNEQTEQKERHIINLDSDDEDERIGASKQLTPEKNKQFTPEKNKQLIPSEQDGALTRVVTEGIDGANETMHDTDQNSQLVPYSPTATLMNHYPLASYQPSAVLFERVILQKRPEEERIHDLAVANHKEKIAETQLFPALKERKKRKVDPSSQVDGDAEIVPRKSKGKNEANPAVLDLPSETGNPVREDGPMEEDEPMGEDEPMEEDEPMVEEDKPENESDGLEDIWNDYGLAIESSKLDKPEEVISEKEVGEKEVDTVCHHDIQIHEDLGHVCRVCGMIVRKADTIFDYQWNKASRSRSYFCETRSKDSGKIVIDDVVTEELIALDIAIHPRHEKQMRPHQLAGFHFLVKNLVSDKPGGCILAHAPGSGKTFMLISFIQSFLAKYPSGRPLVVLPKGILGTWKREFQRWQVEDIPLYDLYSVKADRSDQLEILSSWQANRSILLTGYAQFSWIISSDGDSPVEAACRDKLLRVPNLLIMDEGHTPRTESTNVLESLRRVQTPRKVVLSGTLFQNHVSEVFNIVNLVRPKFLKKEPSRSIVTRIMSQVSISGRRNSKGDIDKFTESVEETLLHDGNFTRKANVIRSLRELTKDVLHYYKGDILDELPGLVDLSVFLKLSPKQKEIVHKLEAYEKFKRNAVGTALYMHPCLSEISEVDAADRATNVTDAAVDTLVQSINVADGVKARFFTNILALAESKGEKVLAFSQYILPMKFLERILVKTKGWQVGKEMFVIRGDSKSTPEGREATMDQFNNSSDAKVLFGSIKACGEGISLVGASRVVILDVHLNPSVTRQAIGRAFRPGQHKKVFVYRLVAADSPEENVHKTAFKKEVIPKLWFEWSEQRCTSDDFQLNEVDIDDCGDEFLDNRAMRQDIKALYAR